MSAPQAPPRPPEFTLHTERLGPLPLINHFLVAALAAEGREVPGYVAREFEEYLRCGRLEHGSVVTD